MKIKTMGIIKIVSIFVGIIFIVNLAFSGIYYFINNIILKNISTGVNYFDISLFTIGYGNQPNVSKFILFLQGIIGICLISLLSAYLTVKLFRRDDDVIITDKMVIRKEGKDKYSCCILICNRGRDIYSLSAELLATNALDFESTSDNSLHFDRPILTERNIWQICYSIDKSHKFYPYFENAIVHNDMIIFNLIFRFIDSKTGLESILHQKFDISSIRYGKFELPGRDNKKNKNWKMFGRVAEDAETRNQFLSYVSNTVVELDISNVILCSENNDTRAIHKDITEREDKKQADVYADFSKNSDYETIPKFVSAVLKFPALQDWGYFFENNYSLGFKIRSSENIKEIKIEVKSTKYPFLLINNPITTSTEFENYEINLKSEGTTVDAWMNISEICFVVTPSDMTGRTGSFSIYDLHLGKKGQE